jgi:hypothetical protein
MSTHQLWWTVPNMAAMDTVYAAFEAHEKKIISENPDLLEKMLSIVDLTKHSDDVIREIITGHGSEPPAPGARPYTWMFSYKILPGHDEEYLALFNEYSKPVLDKMVTENSINAYGLAIPEVRSTNKFTHLIWISVDSFGEYEKARELYMAAYKERSAEENKEMVKKFLAISDPEASRTYVFREVIFELAPM